MLRECVLRVRAAAECVGCWRTKKTAPSRVFLSPRPLYLLLSPRARARHASAHVGVLFNVTFCSFFVELYLGE